jgi:hypothetical protein
MNLARGFSFAGGTSRLDAKRQLIVQEANAIGTAYLRLDELPAKDQPKLRRIFREYLDARLRVYEKLPNLNAAEQDLLQVRKLQDEIWNSAVAGCRNDPTEVAGRLLLPAVNNMIDVTNARSYTQLPPLIFILLSAVALISGLLAGYAMAKRRSRSQLHMVLYAFVIAVTVYAILDLEYPRFGLIRLDAADKALVQLRDSIR